MLRFAHDDAAIDIEVRAAAQGDGLQVTVAVEGLPAGGRIALVDHADAPLAAAALDATDGAVLALADAQPFRAVVEDADGEILRTPLVERGAT